MRYVQRATGAAFLLTLTALVVFWTVKDTRPTSNAVLPILYAVLAGSALAWLGAELRSRRQSRTTLDMSIGGVMIGDVDECAVLQPTVSVQNNATATVPIYGWHATLELEGRNYDLRHLFGQDRLRGSLDLPALDQVAPLPPGQTAGLLQFAVPDMRQEAVVAALAQSKRPLQLRLELLGSKGRRWRTESDLRHLAAQKRATVPATAPRTMPAAITHEPLLWGQLTRRPEPGEEDVPLQPWIEDRLATHAKLVRERGARGDEWFFEALAKWDVRNTHELLTRVAPDLVDDYYRGTTGPGFVLGEEATYYERQLRWLQTRLDQVDGDISPNPI